MPPNELQKQAIEYLEGPLLVLAGPGTGKTQLLSEKVKYILENTDANPENILCLTFTDSGTQNMQDRLMSMIGKAATKVQIHTYHAFGSDILAEYRNFATEYIEKLDNPVTDISQYKIVQEIQDGLDGRDILRGDSIKDIIDTIGSAKSARLSPDDLEKIAYDNIETSKKMGPELAKIFNGEAGKGLRFYPAVEKIYGPVREVLAKYVQEEPIVGNIYKEANTYLFELNQIIEEESQKEKPSVKPLTSWREKRFDNDENGNFRLKNVVANKKLLSFARVLRAYNQKLLEENSFDYSDMIEEAITVLKEDKAFRATLSERYQYILLDEFQDTNPSQAELVRLLTDYEKPIIMAVGDDDQAIFEFQGANASNFIDYQNHYGAKVITLKDNYRSTAEILKLSRCIADQLESSFAKTRNIDKNLVARRNLEKGTIERHEFLSADGEYFYVAEKIAELVKSGVPQKEIAIIAPKHKYIIPLLPYLKAHEGIFINYEKRDNLFLDTRISELITLARFIEGVAKDEPVSHLILPILSFPCFEISPLAAIRASRKDSKKSAMDYFTDSDDQKIQALGEFLAHLVQKSFEAPIEMMLDYMVGTIEVADGIRSPFLAYYSQNGAEYTEFSLYENLSVLRAKLAEYLQNVEQPKLSDLLRFVDDSEMAGVQLLNTSPYSESDDAVQVLTAHKAKGLEFSYVFLIAMDNNSWGKGGGNNNLLVLPANVIQIRHTGVTEDERLRLLFVAMTRAKTNLYLTNSLTDFAGKQPKRLSYLEEYEKDGVLISSFIGEVKTHYADLEEAKKQTDLRLSWVSAYKNLTPELKPILQKRLESYRLTATDLTSFIDVCYGGPMEFYKTKVLLSPREPMSGALIFGTLIHATFDKVTKEKISDEEAMEYFRAEVLKQAASPEDQKYMLECGTAALEKSLQKFANVLRAPESLSELDFYNERLQIGDTPITGKIDHINIDKENKTIEIYDYKTSRYSDKKWDSTDTLYKYKMQLGFYKLLLNLSPNYAKYKISQGHILFVTPDGYDEVHDKVYDFNEADEAELKSLINAVYHEIKTLDFVEDPAIFVEADENKGLKDIRELVGLLIDKNR